MSSGFVPSGNVSNPTSRDEEWTKAQSDLDAARRRKEELSQQQDGKTLYEVLQANRGDYALLHIFHLLLKSRNNKRQKIICTFLYDS